jgi:predicted RNA-binding Zn-ribbon protein involved in translation (DUF1610 family)
VSSYSRNCPKCGKVITYRTRTGHSGAEKAGTTCRSCVNVVRWEKKEAKADDLPFFECKNCGKRKRADGFSKHASCACGYDTSRCKDCKKAARDYGATSHEYRIFNRARSRARKKGQEFNITLADIVIPELCPVFGVKLAYGDLDWTPSIDRIDASRGYVKGNIAIISNKANRLKNNATAEELRTVAAWLDLLI